MYSSNQPYLRQDDHCFISALSLAVLRYRQKVGKTASACVELVLSRTQTHASSRKTNISIERKGRNME